jgi:hypothetical protein
MSAAHGSILTLAPGVDRIVAAVMPYLAFLFRTTLIFGWFAKVALIGAPLVIGGWFFYRWSVSASSPRRKNVRGRARRSHRRCQPRRGSSNGGMGIAAQTEAVWASTVFRRFRPRNVKGASCE